MSNLKGRVSPSIVEKENRITVNQGTRTSKPHYCVLLWITFLKNIIANLANLAQAVITKIKRVGGIRKEKRT